MGMSHFDIAKGEFLDYLKRKFKPKEKVQYQEPPLDQKELFKRGSNPVGKDNKTRFGGVVVLDGKILLVNPTNNFGNYAWTFPKGGASAGETPEEAAKREVEEESGYVCKVLRKIKGNFAGTTSDTEYFLMRPLYKGEHGWETQQIFWGTFEQAKEGIKMTGEMNNFAGMRRDLKVLYAAFGKELSPEELKEIEKEVEGTRKKKAAEKARKEEEELRAKYGDEGYEQYKREQEALKRYFADKAKLDSQKTADAWKKRSDLRQKRKEELLRWKLGDEGYEKYQQFLADKEAEKAAKLKQQTHIFNIKRGAAASYGMGNIRSLPGEAKKCHRCDSLTLKYTPQGDSVLVTCQECGAQWVEKKAPAVAVKKWVPPPKQLKFKWPEDK